MNTNRKADLQRKLTLVPAPKPPAGLAERIKTEIPKHLRFDAERERERLSQSVAFNIRVAASILILISCAYLALQVMTRVYQKKPANVMPVKRQLQPPVAEPQVAAAPPTRPAPQKLAKQTRAKKEKAADAIAVAPAAPPVAAMAEAAPAREEAKVRTPAATAALSGVEMRDQMNKSVAQVENEVTTSPISGKIMMRSATPIDRARRLDKTDVYELDSIAGSKVVPWKDASPRTKAAILQAELAAGGDPKAIARAAREAGLEELANSIEKQQH